MSGERQPKDPAATAKVGDAASQQQRRGRALSLESNEDDMQDDDIENADGPGDFADELKAGATLLRGQYTIVEFLNSGGFGITYLAKDSLDRTVVIKECFPSTFCRRSEATVRARSRAHQQDFRSIVKLFVQEARNLSKLVHPNIVGVHQVFEDNDTAYMAIDFVDGRDLLEIIEDPNVKLKPEQIVKYMKKMLAAVNFIHERGVLHRDISPDNILIDAKDEPILIDFGAAREEASKTSRALSALRVVKDGYSPQEFYISGSTQTPSSDLYSLAAAFYHAISGSAPPNSQKRLAAIADETGDPYKPLEGHYAGYPPAFLEAIDKAISVLPKDRIKSAGEWLEVIERGSISDPNDKVRDDQIANAVSRIVKGDAAPPAPQGLRAKIAQASAGRPVEAAQRAAAASAAAPARAADKRPIMLGAAAAVGALAVGVAVMMMGSDSEPAAPALAATETAPEAEPEETAALEPAPAPEPAPAEETASAEETPAPAEETAIVEASEISVEGQSAVDVQVVSASADLSGIDFPEPPDYSDIAVSGEAAIPALAVVAAERSISGGDLAELAPETNPRVIEDQILGSAAQVELPFETEPVVISGDPFPTITAVRPTANPADVESWLREGTIIFSVNEEWVSDQAQIEAIFAAIQETSPDGYVTAEVRARLSLDEPFITATLSAPVTQSTMLVNGIVFASAPTASGWQTVVASVSEETENGLAVGDLVVSESTFGAVAEPAQFVDAIRSLAADKRVEARFTVLRDGNEMAAVMPLALAE
jgi:serine/threonine protein kinase